ncbi:hypothetical protein ACWIG4_30220 [Streptomyces sp. NPDC002248]
MTKLTTCRKTAIAPGARVLVCGLKFGHLDDRCKDTKTGKFFYPDSALADMNPPGGGRIR